MLCDMPTKYVLSLIILSLCVSSASGADETDTNLNLPKDFEGKLLYEVPNRQGSWVSMAPDPKGRLIVSDQYGGLYRVDVSKEPVQVEPIPVKLGFAQGLLCAFDSLYVVAHEGKFDQVEEDGEKSKLQRPAGLYRVKDTDGDDQYDSVELLREFQGGGEHGPHAVILGPNKRSLYICAGNHTKIPDPETSKVPRLWQEDQLTPRLPDAGGHAVGMTAPGGWICKTDLDGKVFELISVGFRNQYDIAFDLRGELFTYDADMEWDIGLPWYRPTRVCHVTSGSEFGWRNGSGKWPTYYPDSVPPVIDIGPGSPTGITFGIDSNFPHEYQKALYIADWSYGIIYQVDLKFDNGTYSATKKTFCTAPVLPVTDIVINPKDGAMYFLVGGRRSKSALYRVKYTGKDWQTPLVRMLDRTPDMRKEVETYQDGISEDRLDSVWSFLQVPSRNIRYAARTAIELHNDDSWYEKAFTESNAQAKLEALLALIRKQTDDSLQARTIDSLNSIDFVSLTEEQQLHLLRNYGLVLMRMGEPKETTLESVHSLSKFYPNKSEWVNRELARLLAATEADDVVEKTIDLMEQSDSQKQQIHYAMVLHSVKNGWTNELRKRYLNWFVQSAKYAGGSSFRTYLTNIRRKFAGELAETERESLKELVEVSLDPVDPYQQLKARPLVKKWTMNDLQDISLENRNLENGKKMFALTQCYKCHVVAGEGGIVGPDLTNAGRRFGKQDLLETIIEPNKEISDQYKATIFLLDDGRVISGRVANLVRNEYLVQEDMINPGKFTRINSDNIEEMKPSAQSMMPSGLLDSLTKDEIADLLAYMKSVAIER